MVPGQNTKVSVKPAVTRFFRPGTRFMHQTNPLQYGFQIIGKIAVRQGRTFRNTRGPTGINNQRQIFSRINFNLGRLWLGSCDHIIKKKMPRLVISGFGYFPQKPSDKSFDGRQIGFDAADDHRVHVRISNRLDGGRIKLGMIHAKNHFGTGIF